MRYQEELEILDLDDKELINHKSNIIETKIEKKKDEKNEPIQKKKKIKKALVFQVIFCTVSFLFIIGCFIFYGARLIKYYKIYNPKTEEGVSVALLHKQIIKESPIVYEGDGLYKVGSGYIYKGKDANNYVKIGSLMFRIVNITSDGYIELILDDYINVMAWNQEATSFIDSDINKYINDKFLSIINTDILAKSAVCVDKITEISDISCNTINTDNYVKLLDITNFLNSVSDDTYISDEEIIWLSNYGDKVAWNTNGTSVSYSDPSSMYLVKPVITLKNNLPFVDGNGTKEKPYLVRQEKKELSVGSYVKIGDDTWIVYESSEDSVKLVLNKLLTQLYQFSSYNSSYSAEAEKSIGKYLNTTYYESLEYKDLLLETKWYIGEFKNSYKDIYNESTVAKVGIYNLADLKFNNELNNYYLSTFAPDKNVYVYGESMKTSKPSISRGVRPTISIKKTNIVSGDGTSSSPYLLGGSE